MDSPARHRSRSGWAMVLPTLLTVLTLAWPAVASANDGSRSVPQGDPPILTVAGTVASGDAATVTFTRAELEALPQARITTTTPWTDGSITFEGPLVRDVLAQACCSGTAVEARAINAYRITIPVQDFLDYDVILALRRDGELLTRRDQGPVWIVYPRDSYPELNSVEYYARWVWQLRRLDVL